MLAFLSFSFTNLTEDSTVIPPAQQQQIADTLEDDAEVMSNAQLEPLLADEPEDVQAEILRINKQARDRSLQVALLVPVLAEPPRPAQRLPHETPPRPDAGRHRRRRAGLSTTRVPAGRASTCEGERPEPRSCDAGGGVQARAVPGAAGGRHVPL